MIRFPRSKSFRWIFVGAVATQVVSCGVSYVAPPVTPDLARKSSAPKSRLELGYELHLLKCAKCHTFEDPRDYDADELEFDIMPEMGRKSKLTEDETQAVLEYLLAARTIPKEPAQ